jgi:hypothetical protein
MDTFSSITCNNLAPTVLNVTTTLNINTTGSGITTVGNPVQTSSIQSNNLSISSNSSNITTLNTNATANYNLNLPVAQGGANQIFSNDGSGNLSWSNHGCVCQSLVVYVDFATSVGNGYNVLTDTVNTAINLRHVFVGSQYLTPTSADGITTPYTAFVIPVSGTYSFIFGGWLCGNGSGQARMRVFRSSTLVFDRCMAPEPFYDCGTTDANFLWNNFQVGDVCSFYMNMNGGGGYNGIINVSTTRDSGTLIIYYEQ